MCWMTETLTGAAIAAGGVKQPIDAFSCSCWGLLGGVRVGELADLSDLGLSPFSCWLLWKFISN